MKQGIIVILVFFLIQPLTAQVNVLHMEQLSYRDGLPHNSVQSIKQDKYGFIWFSSFAGLSRFDGYRFNEFFPDPENPKTIYTKSVYNLVLDSAMNLWVAFFDTSLFCMYNYPTNDFIRVNSLDVPPYIKEFSNRKTIVTNVAETASEKWELRDNMLFRTTKQDGTVKQFYMNLSSAGQFVGSRIKTMFLDSFGTLWIGTEDRGVFKVNIYTKPFYSFFYNDQGQPKMISNIVRAIFQDDDRHLYIGTQYDGLFVLDRHDHTLQRIGGPEETDYRRLKGNLIRCLHRDRLGHLWIGTKSGLGEYFPESGRIRNYNRFGAVNLPHNWAYAVTEDQQGNIWVGTFGGGIARYDRENDRFVHIDPYRSLANSRVYCMITDRNNNLWVGTHGGGVSCLKLGQNPDQYESTHFLNEPGNVNSISSNRIFCLHEDHEGYIWVATDYGLNRINPRDGSVTRYFHQDGLSDDIVFSITEDQSGNLWLSNQKGISKLNLKTGRFSHYNEKDGLPGNEMSENAVFRNSRTGELIFGGLSGLVSFFPDQIVENHILPKVVLTRLEVLNQEVEPGEKINNRIILDKHISLTDKIVLNYSHRSFTIEFAALHFANPMSNEYQYILEKYDHHWISTSASRRFATYSNLPAGNYLFKVKASNDDGLWSPEVRTLAIKIRPPWWFSIWAFIFYVVIISSISYFSILYVVARMNMKNEVRYEKMKARKIEELNQMKEQFFTKISHELRTPLTLLLDPLRKMNSGSVDPAEQSYFLGVMYQNAQRMSKLVNELLDFRKVESKEFVLKPEDTELVSFLFSILNAFKLNASERDVRLMFKSSHQSITAAFDRDVVEKIIFNLLSNAIKYNHRGGQVTCSVELLSDQDIENRLVRIQVADTGRGISPENLGKVFDLYYQEGNPQGIRIDGSGIGLSLSRELVLLCKGTIDVDSVPEQGTVFTVELPIATQGSGPSWEQGIETDKTGFSLTEENDHDQFEEESDEIRYKILIVEDNDDVRAYIRRDLSVLFETIEAVNGKDGWEKAHDSMPDLIVTDLMMPEMDGYALLHKVKQERQTSHIPVIVLTALSSEKAMLEAIELGADAYVSKPFSSSLLRARIKTLIQSRRSLIESIGKYPFIDVKKIAGNSLDETFLNKAVEFIETNISEPNFNIDLMADNLSISRRHLSHKIKTLTGQTVNEFVKTVRLNKGAELMLNTDQTISEIAYQLGYTAPANFSRSFSKQFGKTPTDYIASFEDNKE